MSDNITDISQPEHVPNPPVGKRTGGRAVGTPNRSTFYKRHIFDVCKKMGLDPIESLVRFVMNLDPATGEPYSHQVLVGKGENQTVETIVGYDPAIRLGAAKELASFVAPKRKAVEHSDGTKKRTVFQVITEDQAQAEEAQAEMAKLQEEKENNEENENETDE